MSSRRLLNTHNDDYAVDSPVPESEYLAAYGCSLLTQLKPWRTAVGGEKSHRTSTEHNR